MQRNINKLEVIHNQAARFVHWQQHHYYDIQPELHKDIDKAELHLPLCTIPVVMSTSCPSIFKFTNTAFFWNNLPASLV